MNEIGASSSRLCDAEQLLCPLCRDVDNAVAGLLPQTGCLLVERVDGRVGLVAFKEEGTRCGLFQGVGVVSGADAQEQSFPAQLLGLLWFPAKAVYQPPLGGTSPAFEGDERVESFHAVYDKGLAEAFREVDVSLENFDLATQLASACGVEAALADGNDLRQGGDAYDFGPVGFGRGVALVGVDTGRETAVGALLDDCRRVVWIGVADGILPFVDGAQPVGVHVVAGDARHGVVAASAPGVAAGYAPQGQPQTESRAVPAYGADGVLRAGGHIAAAGWFQRGDAGPVEVYGEQQEGRYCFSDEPHHGKVVRRVRGWVFLLLPGRFSPSVSATSLSCAFRARRRAVSLCRDRRRPARLSARALAADCKEALCSGGRPP